MKFVLSFLGIEYEPGTDGESNTNDCGKSADSPDVLVDNSRVFERKRFAKMVTDSLLAPSREGVKANSESSIGGTSTERNNSEQTASIKKSSTLTSVLHVVTNELHQKEALKKNVVIHGLLPVDGVQHNLLVSELLETNFCHSAPIGRVRHVGQRLPGKVQPLIVSFTDVTAAAYFVSNAKQLRGSADTYTRQSLHQPISH